MKITIGITTYNRDRLLIRALNSVLKQTYKNFEVIIGNDYIHKKIDKNKLNIFDNRIRIYNHKINLGENKNMNFLLNKAKSKWFTWLADDDYMEPNFLMKLIKNIEKSNYKKNVVASYSNYRRIIKRKNKKKFKTGVFNYNHQEFINKYLTQEIRLIGVYGIINTKILKKIRKNQNVGSPLRINGKSTGVYAYTDFILPIMLSKYGQILWDERKLVNVDITNDAISFLTNDYLSYFSSQNYVAKKLNRFLKSKIVNISSLNMFADRVFYHKAILLKRSDNLIFEDFVIYIKYSLNFYKTLTNKINFSLYLRLIKNFFSNYIKKK